MQWPNEKGQKDIQMFENTKRVIRRSKLKKDRQYIGQKKI